MTAGRCFSIFHVAHWILSEQRMRRRMWLMRKREKLVIIVQIGSDTWRLLLFLVLLLGLLFHSIQSIVRLPQTVGNLSVAGIVVVIEVNIQAGLIIFGHLFLSKSSHSSSFARLTFTIAIVVAKKIFSIIAGKLFFRFDRTQCFQTGRISSGGHELTISSTIVIDEGTRSEPKLGTILSAWVHYGKIVDTWFEHFFFFLFAQLGNASDQHFDLFILEPALSGRQFGTALVFGWVPVKREREGEKNKINLTKTKPNINFQHFWTDRCETTDLVQGRISKPEFRSNIWK